MDPLEILSGIIHLAIFLELGTICIDVPKEIWYFFQEQKVARTRNEERRKNKKNKD